jgi:hypothetical protein
MAHRTIRVATDFSRYPAGRYESDGPFSGERFRNDFLIPELAKGTTLTIELDGARGYGSSFLEEAFGGLVRAGYSPKTLRTCLQLISKDASLVEEIKEYIDGAVATDTT